LTSGISNAHDRADAERFVEGPGPRQGGTPPELRRPEATMGRSGVTLRRWARDLKRDVVALWIAARDPRVPWHAKALAGTVAAYALSPIDLIPDFIPVLGQLDDLVIVPLGIALVTRLTPKPLWEARLREAEVSKDKLPRLWWGVGLVLLTWLVLMALFVWWLVGLFA
jgi:uncharacterized membrane protein YkvA (DUF1232 family)